MYALLEYVTAVNNVAQRKLFFLLLLYARNSIRFITDE